MAKTALVRQPYSVAVLSTGGRLHPLPYWKGRGLGSGLRTLPQGFLSPTRGTEGVVKTIEDRWGIKCLRNEVFLFNSLVFTSESSIFAAVFNIGGYTMIEIKETLVIKSDSPKVAEWVKRMKAYKAAQLQDMAKRGCEVCEIAM